MWLGQGQVWEKRAHSGPVTGNCPCGNPEYPCYAYYATGVNTLTVPVRTLLNSLDKMTLTLRQALHCPQVVSVPASRSTVIQLLKTVQHSVEHSVALSPPQRQRRQQPQVTQGLPQQPQRIQAGLVQRLTLVQCLGKSFEVHQMELAGVALVLRPTLVVDGPIAGSEHCPMSPMC